MLRIAVVTRYFPSSGEPTQGRSLYETLRIVARSAEVQVFYPNADYPGFLKPSSRSYDKLDRSFSPPEVSVSYFDYPAIPVLSRPFNGWIATRRLLPHVRAFAPDLIFGCFVYPEGYAALKIAKALGVPVVVMSIGSDLNRVGDPLSARHTRFVLQNADEIMTVSDDLRRKATEMGAIASRACTIHNGCDLGVFHPRDRHEARKRLEIDPTIEAVLYVGRLDRKKGLSELVEAATLLRSSRPALHIYMVGTGPDRSLIENAVHTLNADEIVHLIPGCRFEEVAVWMAAADLVTLPSYMEGCPNVILEALACGRPVVATRVGGIPEILNETCGRLVPPRDPRSLAEAIAAVLDTSWRPSAIAANSSRSWEAAAAEFLRVFETLV